jgi:hypothetical protein
LCEMVCLASFSSAISRFFLDFHHLGPSYPCRRNRKSQIAESDFCDL